MLFFGAFWLSLVVVCLSEEVWDPTDPACEEVRQGEKQRKFEMLDKAYELIERYEEMMREHPETEYFRRIRSEIQPGCDDYESLKRTQFRCWPKDFLCTATEVAKKTVTSFNMKKNYQKREHYSDIVDNLDWIIMVQWNDPRLMYWDKKDIDELGNTKIFPGLFNLIKNNEYRDLKDVFDQYHSEWNSYGAKILMEEQCRSKSEDDVQCKLGIVFDRLTTMLEDPVKDVDSAVRGEIYFLYLLKPDVYKIMIRSDDSNVSLNQGLRTMFTSFFDNARNKDGTKMKAHFGHFNTICTLMEQDCDQLHSNDFEQMECYMSETCERMKELKNSLGADYSNWESPSAQYMRPVILVWLLLTPKGSFYVDAAELVQVQSIKELPKIMYTKIRENDLPTLLEIANRIPSKDQMGLTTNDDCAPNFNQISREIKCGFKIILDNFWVFYGQYNSKDTKTKRISLTVNYKQRLQQFQISSIKGAIENTKLELKSSLEEFSGEIKLYFENSLGNRFDNLKQYYQSLASFDLEIANADTTFINGKLTEFANTATELNAKLKYDSSELQVEGIIIKSIDAAFMWLKAAGAGVTAVLGIFTGDISGFADAADRVDDAAKETLEAIKGEAIADQIQIAASKFKIIADGLKDNQNQLEKTKILIDKLNDENADLDSEEFKTIQSDFIKAYNAYDPKVNEAQIAELDTAWSEVVDNLEGLMDSMNTKEGIAGATKSFANNHFFKIKLVVPQLTQTLNNNFDFQFEMMDSLAAAVRAHTSRQGAEALSEGFSDLDRQQTISVKAQIALDQMALSTYILSQYHLLKILSQYCNYIKYVNAGVDSYECTTALRTMIPAQVDNAISFEPPSCDPANVDLKIPTSLSGKTDSINLNQLNSGESVPFQIPNFEWLMTNGEISALDKQSALFVKLFEVYAITNDNYQIKNNLRVTVTPSGSAPIYPTAGQIKYELLPSSRTSYVFEYLEDYTGSCETEKNPYLVCTPGPKGICVRSRGELNNKLGAYPSIYSPWTIQLDKNIGNAPNPAKDTILYLKAKLQLCRKTKDYNARSLGGARRRSLRKKLRKNKAHLKRYIVKSSKHKDAVQCPDGKYYDQHSKTFVACSDGSAPAHNNYYCEMNSD